MSKIAYRVAQKWLQAAVTGPGQCPKCRGTGFVNLGDCPNCGGTGIDPNVRPKTETKTRMFEPDVYGCYSLWPDGQTERILRVRMVPTGGGAWEMETLQKPAYGPDLTADMIKRWTVPAKTDGSPDFEDITNLPAFEEYVTLHFEAGEHLKGGMHARPGAPKMEPDGLIRDFIGDDFDPVLVR